MGWCAPSGPKQAAWTLLYFSTGLALFYIGGHLSYVHVEPQRARTIARDEFVKEHFRKKHGN